ncbi:MAG: hypothetical protein IPI48_03940 [bacterium]|nr:hypothetical protein [bacterium]
MRRQQVRVDTGGVLGAAQRGQHVGLVQLQRIGARVRDQDLVQQREGLVQQRRLLLRELAGFSHLDLHARDALDRRQGVGQGGVGQPHVPLGLLVVLAVPVDLGLAQALRVVVVQRSRYLFGPFLRIQLDRAAIRLVGQIVVLQRLGEVVLGHGFLGQVAVRLAQVVEGVGFILRELEALVDDLDGLVVVLLADVQDRTRRVGRSAAGKTAERCGDHKTREQQDARGRPCARDRAGQFGSGHQGGSPSGMSEQRPGS